MLLVELAGLAHEMINGRHDKELGDSIALPPHKNSGDKEDDSQQNPDSMDSKDSKDSLREEPDHEHDLEGASE